MIYTSYFAKSGSNPAAISIAGKTPDWFFGQRYSKLAPKAWFFKIYKETGDQEQYIQHYYEEVLSKLNPADVIKELDGKIMCCYEKPTDFCHRFVVADWMNHFCGIDVKELK